MTIFITLSCLLLKNFKVQINENNYLYYKYPEVTTIIIFRSLPIQITWLFLNPILFVLLTSKVIWRKVYRNFVEVLKVTLLMWPVEVRLLAYSWENLDSERLSKAVRKVPLCTEVSVCVLWLGCSGIILRQPT